MTYRVTGLSPEPFATLFDLDDAALAERGGMRVTATGKPGYPCRISLEDAEPGEHLILLNHVSHNVATPFRASHAIYIRQDATQAAFVDATPPVFASRTLSLRGFDEKGMLRDAALAPPGEADAAIHKLLADDTIAYIHAHNGAPGCFAARIDRTDP